MKKRYVITGLGIVSPYGFEIQDFWKGIKESKSPIAPIQKFDGSSYATKVAGEVPAIPYQEYGFRSSFKRMPLISQYSVLASMKALEDAGLDEEIKEQGSDYGIYLGTRNGALGKTGDFYKKAVLKGPYRSNPLSFQETVFNSIAAKISLKYKITGPSYVTPSGMTGMMNSLDLALLQLDSGRIKSALVGGADEFCEVLLQAHCFLKITATDDKSRPFDHERTGILLSEGAVIMIIEELEAAVARGGKIYGEIAAISTLNDPHSVADNDPEGQNLTHCMQDVLNKAGLKTVDCLVSTANGNKSIDAGELSAIKNVFGNQVPITNIKSLIGDCGGAGAGMNIASALMMLEDGFIPAIQNLETYSEGYDFVLEARSQELESVMVNAVGFGGSNYSIILKKY